ncbi:heterokaryon incompatibility protein [Colletotrichum kahawae]|uniref:Heterokaryon incompatibility protein n=1 Tax=Colletotrichum kahawae TaxID=34407 RepID=A0AAD9YVT7_COLKA|nr:heterokaryon incompatibility protein [Colletotrichum kahawae]
MEVPTERGYRYRALSGADSVRLLTISRADDQPHGMLLSLKEAQLDDQPGFAALSYTWKLPEYGNQNLEDQDCGATIEVICDGKVMAISENLFSFLCAALHASETNGGVLNPPDTRTNLVSKVNGILGALPLWIDAFCINQSDSQEKRHQVLLMHRIYSAARNVIVWLGPTQPHPDVLWVHDKFIPAISKLTRKKPDFMEKYLRKDPMCSSAATIEELGPELCSRWLSAWLQFAIYIDRQCWFDRGWIVQEVTLSDPANVYVCCGRSVLSWKRLAAFAQFLQETGWSSTLMEQIEITAAVGKLESFENKRIAYPAQVSSKILKTSQARTSLAEVAQQTGLAVGADTGSTWDGKLEQEWLGCANVLINSLRSSRFGDDRDHIYGCLGMLSMLLPHGCESPIIPDYQSTVEEVFTSTAGIFLTKAPLLTELSRIEKRSARRYSTLPSWVPDYSVEKVRHPVANWNFSINRYLNMGNAELRNAEINLWGCDLRRPKLVGSVLYIHGFLLDTVLEVGADKPFEWKSPGIHALIAGSVPDNSSAVKTSVNNSGFWKTLAYAKSNDNSPKVFKGLSTNNPNSLAGAMYRHLKASPSGLLAPRYTESSDDHVRAELVDRYIYSTEGDELGLGPMTVREADEVWLLEGARTPCIFRRSKSRKEYEPGIYEFIGETDLRSFNIGETDLRSFNIGETDLRSFNIGETDLTSKESRGFYEMICLE